MFTVPVEWYVFVLCWLKVLAVLSLVSGVMNIDANGLSGNNHQAKMKTRQDEVR